MDSALAWSSIYQDEKVLIGSRLHLPLRFTLPVVSWGLLLISSGPRHLKP